MKNAKTWRFCQSEAELVKTKTNCEAPNGYNDDSLVLEYDTSKRKRKAQALIDLGVDSGASKRQKKNTRLSQESVIMEETTEPPVSLKKKKKKKYVNQSEVEEQLSPVELVAGEENRKRKKHKKKRKENGCEQQKSEINVQSDELHDHIQIEARSEEDTKRHKRKKKKNVVEEQFPPVELEAREENRKQKKHKKKGKENGCEQQKSEINVQSDELHDHIQIEAHSEEDTKRHKRKKKKNVVEEQLPPVELEAREENRKKKKHMKKRKENGCEQQESEINVQSDELDDHIQIEAHSEEDTKRHKRKKKKNEVQEQSPSDELEAREENRKQKKHKKKGKENGCEQQESEMNVQSDELDDHIQIEAHSEEDTKRHKRKKKKNEVEEQSPSDELEAREENRKQKKHKKKEKENGCEQQESEINVQSDELDDHIQIEAHSEEDTKRHKRTKKKSEVEEQFPPVELEAREENRKQKKHKKKGKENGCEQQESEINVPSDELDDQIQIEAHSEEDTKRHKLKTKKYEDDQIADCKTFKIKIEVPQQECHALVAPKKKKNKDKNEHEMIKEQFPIGETNVSSKENENHKETENNKKQKRKTTRSKIKEEKTERGRKGNSLKQENTKWSVVFSHYNFDSDNEDLLKEEVAWLEARAEEIKEKNRLSSAEEKKFSELRITVPWPVPPLHMIETRITMRPNEQQKRAIEELGVPIKSATYYSKIEDEQITKNWKHFCKMHDLPEDPKPFHNTVNPDGHVIISVPERLNFVRFLAHNLEDRLLCSVYKRFRRLFPQQQQKTGIRFTPEEDSKIVKYLAKSSSRTPCADLGALLGRNKDSIEKRARILREEASFGNLDVKWNTDRIQEFINHAVKVTQVKKVKHLKKREITTKEWRFLEKKLGIPVRKLQKGWACRIYPMLFAKAHASTKQVKESLIRLLLQRGERDFKTLDWNLIQKELGKDGQGFTGRGLHELLQGMIYHCVPVGTRNDAKACLEYLQQILKNGGLRGRKIRKINVNDKNEILTQ
ncbi:trichohyalin-like [Zophobas morio]|uniref:trichohyalin-like n=1 Tax=Zophobas morio TaxID=2755281 RepID=UPI00308275D2